MWRAFFSHDEPELDSSWTPRQRFRTKLRFHQAQLLVNTDHDPGEAMFEALREPLRVLEESGLISVATDLERVINTVFDECGTFLIMVHANKFYDKRTRQLDLAGLLASILPSAVSAVSDI
jgi:hypothetical protein